MAANKGGRVLVAYATKYGATEAVAETIADELRRTGITVDVRRVTEAVDIDGYAGVAVGGPVYGGRWLPEAVAFVRDQQGTLAKRPVAYFAVGMVPVDNRDGGDKELATLLGYLHEAAPEVEPVGSAIFAGALDPKTMNFFIRLFLRLRKAPVGDFRDFGVMREWAREVRPALARAA